MLTCGCPVASLGDQSHGRLPGVLSNQVEGEPPHEPHSGTCVSSPGHACGMGAQSPAPLARVSFLQPPNPTGQCPPRALPDLPPGLPQASESGAASASPMEAIATPPTEAPPNLWCLQQHLEITGQHVSGTEWTSGVGCEFQMPGAGSCSERDPLLLVKYDPFRLTKKGGHGEELPGPPPQKSSTCVHSTNGRWLHYARSISTCRRRLICHLYLSRALYTNLKNEKFSTGHRKLI